MKLFSFFPISFLLCDFDHRKPEANGDNTKMASSNAPTFNFDVKIATAIVLVKSTWIFARMHSTVWSNVKANIATYWINAAAPVVCIVRLSPALQWMRFSMCHCDKAQAVCIIMLAHMYLFARFAPRSSYNPNFQRELVFRMLSGLKIASECVCMRYSLVCVAILLSYSAVKSGMFASVHYTYSHLHSVNALAATPHHTLSVQRVFNDVYVTRVWFFSRFYSFVV